MLRHRSSRRSSIPSNPATSRRSAGWASPGDWASHRRRHCRLSSRLRIRRRGSSCHPNCRPRKSRPKASKSRRPRIHRRKASRNHRPRTHRRKASRSHRPKTRPQTASSSAWKSSSSSCNLRAPSRRRPATGSAGLGCDSCGVPPKPAGGVPPDTTPIYLDARDVRPVHWCINCINAHRPYSLTRRWHQLHCHRCGRLRRGSRALRLSTMRAATSACRRLPGTSATARSAGRRPSCARG